MYVRYAESRGWKVETLDASPSEMGGYKEIQFKVQGDKGLFGNEVRIGRAPRAQDRAGRIHLHGDGGAKKSTSPEDLRIDVYRAGGPGGQCVNTTDSAVRITHLPSGLVVQSQDQKSQLQNKIAAMAVLRARLYDKMLAEQQAAEGAERRAQIGTGDRSEKIRTYNAPQDRVTDHRIGFNSTYSSVLLGSGLEEVITALQAAERAKKPSRSSRPARSQESIAAVVPSRTAAVCEGRHNRGRNLDRGSHPFLDGGVLGAHGDENPRRLSAVARVRRARRVAHPALRRPGSSAHARRARRPARLQCRAAGEPF